MRINTLVCFFFLINLMVLRGHASSEQGSVSKVRNYSSILLDYQSNPDQFAQQEIHSEAKSSYSSISKSHISGVVSVCSLKDLGTVMAHHARWTEMGFNLFQLTTVGSQMSFGQQSLPPVQFGVMRQLQLDLRSMNAVRVVSVSDDRVRVWAEGGVTWEHLINEASRISGKQLVPFDTPSSDKISVAGALASNTFSRTSEFQEGFSSSHFHSFDLMTPKKHLRCAPDSEDKEETECFALIPGALGAAGVIVAVELDLKVIDSDTVVHTRVFEHAHGVNNIAERFLSLAIDNRQNKEWDQGFYAIVHEEKDGPYGIFMGSKTGRKTEVYRPYIMPHDWLGGAEMVSTYAECQLYEASEYDCSRGMELYDHDLGYKSSLIQLSRRTTPYMINKTVRNLFWDVGVDPGFEFSVSDWVKKFKLFEGAKFTNDFYDYTYYHNGYWEAHGGTVKEELPNMHQAWVMDVSVLDDFMEQVNHLLRHNVEYEKYVLANIILEDITPVPDNHRPMFPTSNQKGHGIKVVYQITVTLDDGKDLELTRFSTAFYRELSKKVQAYASVYLLKEAHVSDQILRKQYAEGISRVRAFCEKFDPDRLFNSALWERLMPDGYQHD